jgi:hypothetical protein
MGSVATAAQLAEELSRHGAAHITSHATSHGTSHASVDLRQLTKHPEHVGYYKRKRLRSLIKPPCPRPPRAELERACRIALMETEEPVPVELIYDRIVRRGSVMFLSYKRPFRAITLAMCTLVALGEASLLRTGSQRRWQRTSSLMSCERSSRS